MRTDSQTNSHILLFFLIILGVIPFLWPGDTPWVNDEPLFILKALETYQGKIATTGLEGTRGVTYGPMAIWIYSLCLFFTKDLIQLIVLRTFLVTSITVISIFWLARLTQLKRIWGAIALLSPYLWFYSRPLWDNTFLIPLSALALASYIAFCLRPTALKLFTTLACLTAMCLIHLMSLAFILPILLHFLYFYRPWFSENKKIVLFQISILLLFFIPYFIGIGQHLFLHPSATLNVTEALPSPPSHYQIQGWFFPWLGGRFFSGWGLDYFFGQHWAENNHWIPFFSTIVKISYLGLCFVWFGILLAAKRFWKWNSEGRPKSHDTELNLDLITLGIFTTMIFMNGIMQTFGHPHYYNATWICYFYFLWRALSFDPARGKIFFSTLKVLYVFCLAFIVPYLILTLHHHGGNRDIHYGATLKNQIEVAQKLQRYDPKSSIDLQVKNYILFPHALTALRKICHLEGTVGGPLRTLKIGYLHPEGNDGWITVEEREK